MITVFEYGDQAFRVSGLIFLVVIMIGFSVAMRIMK